ncbi:hypothetical protein EUGRSUZ_K00105 [Eucalyptus grandis]|uniref:Uncharacterized protein n=2 Tax=Eucalyptus grandis TaxID=71139 RepID=A0ACC3IPC6_EUCGR|nr:hypothetical protein EUGRSUZ_K00105 [Eucalyptus grandis]
MHAFTQTTDKQCMPNSNARSTQHRNRLRVATKISRFIQEVVKTVKSSRKVKRENRNGSPFDSIIQRVEKKGVEDKEAREASRQPAISGAAAGKSMTATRREALRVSERARVRGLGTERRGVLRKREAEAGRKSASLKKRERKCSRPLLLRRAVDPVKVRRDLPRDRAGQRQGQRLVSGGEPGAARERDRDTEADDQRGFWAGGGRGGGGDGGRAGDGGGGGGMRGGGNRGRL